MTNYPVPEEGMELNNWMIATKSSYFYKLILQLKIH